MYAYGQYKESAYLIQVIDSFTVSTLELLSSALWFVRSLLAAVEAGEIASSQSKRHCCDSCRKPVDNAELIFTAGAGSAGGP